MNLKMRVLKDNFAIVKYSPNTVVPKWVFSEEWYSITRTDEELSIVCRDKEFPDGTVFESGWKCMAVVGPLDFGLIGILSTISGMLATSKISIFVVSTYNTDYILVKAHLLNDAMMTLRNNGIEIEVN